MTKTLFTDLLKNFETTGNLHRAYIEGALRNLIYFIQKDPIKDDPEMKKILKDMITKAEKANIDIMHHIIKNTAGLDNQKEAIAYAHELIGREHPDIAAKKKQEMEQKEQERYRREQAALNPPRQQQPRQQQVAQQQPQQPPQE